jgi:hypothetical protein
MKRIASCIALLVVGSAPVLAIDLPALKPGLWQSTTTEDGAAPVTLSMCIDSSMQKEMFAMSQGMMQSMCSKNDLRQEGNRYLSDSECKFGQTTMRTHGVMTFNGDSAYHVQTQASYEPPLMGKKQSANTVEGKFTGPCKPGMQAGDITTAEGKTFNIRNMGPMKKK